MELDRDLWTVIRNVNKCRTRDQHPGDIHRRRQRLRILNGRAPQVAAMRNMPCARCGSYDEEPRKPTTGTETTPRALFTRLDHHALFGANLLADTPQ